MPSAPSLRLLAIPLAFLVLAAGPLPEAGAAGNPGRLQVLDEAGADAPPGNEPRVDCEDFWLAGTGMAAAGGTLLVRQLAPTGQDVALTGGWTGTANKKAFDFLAGPFMLPPGHYMAEADDGDGAAKAKAFWVEPCPTSSTSSSTAPPVETSTSTAPPSSTSTSTAPPSESTTSTPPSETTTSGPPSETTTSTPSSETTTSTAPPEETSTSTPTLSETATSSGTDSGTSTTSSSSSSTGDTPQELACPGEVLAVARGDGSIRLTFEAPTGIDAIRVVRDGGLVATLGADATWYVDVDTVVGDAYTYHVLAVVGGTVSDGCPAMEVTAIPDLGSPWAMALAGLGGFAALALGGRRRQP